MSTLYFNTLSAALLYKWELEGQISDGKYENSRPYDHWKWVCDAKVVVDPSCINYTDRWTKKKYNLNEWVKYMNGTETWAWRAAKYVRFGTCFKSNQENYNFVIENASRYAIDSLKEKYNSYEDMVADVKSWPDYAEGDKFLKIFTEEVYNKYYSVAISTKEFTKYHKLMKETVNDEIAIASSREDEKARKEAEKKAKKTKPALPEVAKQITSGHTESDLLATKQEITAMEMKLAAINFLKEKYGVTPKELCVKL